MGDALAGNAADAGCSEEFCNGRFVTVDNFVFVEVSIFVSTVYGEIERLRCLVDGRDRLNRAKAEVRHPEREHARSEMPVGGKIVALRIAAVVMVESADEVETIGIGVEAGHCTPVVVFHFTGIEVQQR